MVLYMIGLGLYDEKDITVRGLEAVKSSKLVYLEDYTSKLSVSIKKLEDYYGKKVISADRDMVEKNSDEILNHAVKENVSFLVVGDVFSATTHVDIYLRAKEKGIQIEVINNTSILTAIGLVGLELYKYGKTTSMPYFEPSFKPQTPYDVIKQNKKQGLHTLVLLDIKRDLDKYMSVNECLKQFLEIEEERKESVINNELMVVGCARLGSNNFKIKYGKVSALLNEEFGDPLHCLIVPGKMHFMEEDMLTQWKM